MSARDTCLVHSSSKQRRCTAINTRSGQPQVDQNTRDTTQNCELIGLPALPPAWPNAKTVASQPRIFCAFFVGGVCAMRSAGQAKMA